MVAKELSVITTAFLLGMFKVSLGFKKLFSPDWDKTLPDNRMKNKIWAILQFTTTY